MPGLLDRDAIKDRNFLDEIDALRARISILERYPPNKTTIAFFVAASDASILAKSQADYVCDGTDDEVQIQAALDALPSSGGKVVLSEGTFNLSSGVTETSDNVHIQGMGMEATKIVPADGVQAITFNAVFKCSLSDLSIEAASQQTSGGGVRWLDDSWLLLMQRVYIGKCYNGIIVNCYTAGPSDPRAETGYIDHCVFWDTNNHVFQIDWCQGLFISNCAAWNNTDCIRGIAWLKGGGLIISDTDIMKCGMGLAIYPSSGNYCKFLFTSNLALDTCDTYGMIISGDGYVEHHQHSNLHVSNNDGHGIAIFSAPNTNDLYFSNTRAMESGDSGIYLQGVKDIAFVGGMIAGNNQSNNSGTVDEQGVYLINCDNIRFIGLRCSNVNPIGGYQKYGIYHGSGGSDVLVQGCDLGDNQTGGFYSGDWSKVQVRDNAGFITENSGTDSIASGSTVKAVTHGLDATPTLINISFLEQADNDYGRWWLSAIGALTFTLNVSSNPGASNLDFAWEAKVR